LKLLTGVPARNNGRPIATLEELEAIAGARMEVLQAICPALKALLGIDLEFSEVRSGFLEFAGRVL